VHKIERLRHRIAQLSLQLKLAGAGLAAGLMMNATDVQAQASTIGPFVENRLENPLPPPAFDKVSSPALVFWDMDNDGDLDASMGSSNYSNQYLYMFKNNGTPQQPLFKEFYADGLTVEWPGTYVNPGRPAYADIDDDGDKDLVIGMGYYNNGDPDAEDDKLTFYRNTGSATSPYFQQESSDTHPFYNIYLRKESWPAFTDYDKDGDLDFILVGEYYDVNTGLEAWVQFFRNDKDGHTPGVDVTYTQLKGDENPLYVGPSPGNGFFNVAFADLDGDGDEDFFLTNPHGQITYKRNDGGTFVAQTSAYTYQPGGQSTGNPLNVSGITIGSLDNYTSLAFGDLDGDNDTDLVIGTNPTGTFNSAYTYVENTGNGVMVADRSLNNQISGFMMGRFTNNIVTDYDKDGNPDVIATGTIMVPGVENTESPEIQHLAFKNTNGKFEVQTFLNDPFLFLSSSGEGALTMADVDGDSDLDAIFIRSIYDVDTYSYYAEIEYRRNNNGIFESVSETENPFEVPINQQSYYDLGFDIGDLNADGLPDLVVFGNYDVPLIFKNVGSVGNPEFVREDSWRTGLVTETGGYRPKIVDLDNDGDNDLVIGKYLYFWYYENIGDKNTPAWKEYFEYNGGQNLENPFGGISASTPMPSFGDLDGDGDKDLLFADYDDGYYTYYENQNPAPVVTKTNLELPFVPNHPVVLDQTMTISDPDGDKIIKVTVRLEPFEPGKERLQLGGTTPPGLVYDFDNQTGVLTIVGAGTAAAYQDALRAIEYVYIGDQADEGERKASARTTANGRSLAKTITVFTLDSDLTVGPSNTSVFTITHANVVPAITPNAFNVSYNNAAIAVASTATVSDADDTVLASAEIGFSAGTYVASEDRLSATGTANIAVTFDSTAGVLRLTGTATLAEYETVIRSVTYNNLQGASANDATRTLTVKVSDGENDSNIATITLNVITTTPPPVNSPPVITGTAATFWASGEVAINGNLVLTDPNDTTFVGATVTIASGAVLNEDELLFTSQNGITGNYDSNTGQLTLTGTSLITNYQAALRSVRYTNKSATPATGDRSITFAVNDGTESAQLAGTLITINKPPVVSGDDKKTGASGNIAFSISQILFDPDNNLDLSTLVVTSQQGASVKIENGIITIDYSAVPKYEGNDVLTITVCDNGGRCSTHTLNVEVGAEEQIFTGMSPNGDGVNDWFHIDFLPPRTEVAVYNRWGEVIFETDDYDVTDSQKRFEGKNKNGTDVIAGSYYFKVRFPDGRVKTGYLLLNR
jgi:gliding motility-associated-like protein